MGSRFEIGLRTTPHHFFATALDFRPEPAMGNGHCIGLVNGIARTTASGPRSSSRALKAMHRIS
jgi:hypothetical protein